MRKYESIIVFNPELPEAQLKQEIKKVETLLENNGAKNVVVDIWGKRDLAYKVRKQSAGRFVSFVFEAENHEAPNALTAILRISDTVIKFQIYRTADRVRKFKGNPKRAQRGAFDDEFSESMEADY